MSLNDDLLMEILDNEIPEAYRDSIAEQVTGNPLLNTRLKNYRKLQQLMHFRDTELDEQMDKSRERLRDRLNRNLDAAEQNNRRPHTLLEESTWAFRRRTPSHSGYNGAESPREESRRQDIFHRWIRVPAPAAAAALVIFAAAVALNFLPMGRDSGTQMAGVQDEQFFHMNLDNYSEFSEVDPNLVNLLSVGSQQSEPLAPGPRSSGVDGAGEAGGQDGQQGINLQINVQDVEQLLRLLEGTRNLNGSISELTIQLPEISELDLLGESRLMRADPSRSRNTTDEPDTESGGSGAPEDTAADAQGEAQ